MIKGEAPPRGRRPAVDRNSAGTTWLVQAGFAPHTVLHAVIPGGRRPRSSPPSGPLPTGLQLLRDLTEERETLCRQRKELRQEEREMQEQLEHAGKGLSLFQTVLLDLGVSGLQGLLPQQNGKGESTTQTSAPSASPSSQCLAAVPLEAAPEQAGGSTPRLARSLLQAAQGLKAPAKEGLQLLSKPLSWLREGGLASEPAEAKELSDKTSHQEVSLLQQAAEVHEPTAILGDVPFKTGKEEPYMCREFSHTPACRQSEGRLSLEGLDLEALTRRPSKIQAGSRPPKDSAPSLETPHAVSAAEEDIRKGCSGSKTQNSISISRKQQEWNCRSRLLALQISEALGLEGPSGAFAAAAASAAASAGAHDALDSAEDDSEDEEAGKMCNGVQRDAGAATPGAPTQQTPEISPTRDTHGALPASEAAVIKQEESSCALPYSQQQQQQEQSQERQHFVPADPVHEAKAASAAKPGPSAVTAIALGDVRTSCSPQKTQHVDQYGPTVSVSSPHAGPPDAAQHDLRHPKIAVTPLICELGESQTLEKTPERAAHSGEMPCVDMAGRSNDRSPTCSSTSSSNNRSSSTGSRRTAAEPLTLEASGFSSSRISSTSNNSSDSSRSSSSKRSDIAGPNRRQGAQASGSRDGGTSTSKREPAAALLAEQGQVAVDTFRSRRLPGGGPSVDGGLKGHCGKEGVAPKTLWGVQTTQPQASRSTSRAPAPKTLEPAQTAAAAGPFEGAHAENSEAPSLDAEVGLSESGALQVKWNVRGAPTGLLELQACVLDCSRGTQHQELLHSTRSPLVLPALPSSGEYHITLLVRQQQQQQQKPLCGLSVQLCLDGGKIKSKRIRALAVQRLSIMGPPITPVGALTPRGPPSPAGTRASTNSPEYVSRVSQREGPDALDGALSISELQEEQQPSHASDHPDKGPMEQQLAAKGAATESSPSLSKCRAFLYDSHTAKSAAKATTPPTLPHPAAQAGQAAHAVNAAPGFPFKAADPSCSAAREFPTTPQSVAGATSGRAPSASPHPAAAAKAAVLLRGPITSEASPILSTTMGAHPVFRANPFLQGMPQRSLSLQSLTAHSMPQTSTKRSESPEAPAREIAFLPPPAAVAAQGDSGHMRQVAWGPPKALFTPRHLAGYASQGATALNAPGQRERQMKRGPLGGVPPSYSLGSQLGYRHAGVATSACIGTSQWSPPSWAPLGAPQGAQNGLGRLTETPAIAATPAGPPSTITPLELTNTAGPLPRGLLPRTTPEHTGYPQQLTSHGSLSYGGGCGANTQLYMHPRSGMHADRVASHTAVPRSGGDPLGAFRTGEQTLGAQPLPRAAPTLPHTLGHGSRGRSITPTYKPTPFFREALSNNNTLRGLQGEPHEGVHGTTPRTSVRPQQTQSMTPRREALALGAPEGSLRPLGGTSLIYTCGYPVGAPAMRRSVSLSRSLGPSSGMSWAVPQVHVHPARIGARNSLVGTVAPVNLCGPLGDPPTAPQHQRALQRGSSPRGATLRLVHAAPTGHGHHTPLCNNAPKGGREKQTMQPTPEQMKTQEQLHPQQKPQSTPLRHVRGQDPPPHEEKLTQWVFLSQEEKQARGPARALLTTP
ncbi:uncharacterized protein LOC34618833 [Cyclospora cayetanensis]|uniref:Uncharacterized protein LOC34618833 n=1 Tax=Cyclospora cayetanensis TaxID=88456 RepID=A0A6P6S085_9EIME|nr:uncharacterized protein LOC34618833 [Cyclospora cayetanensis]